MIWNNCCNTFIK